MNDQRTPTSLPEILRVLESVAAALRSSDVDRSRQLQARAAELLRSRSLDCGDSLIVGKVMARIRRICPHPSITVDLETCLPPLQP
jgi:hypothetical protein